METLRPGESPFNSSHSSKAGAVCFNKDGTVIAGLKSAGFAILVTILLPVECQGFDYDDITSIPRLESKLFGNQQSGSLSERVSRLEIAVFGTIRSGSDSDRVKILRDRIDGRTISNSFHNTKVPASIRSPRLASTEQDWSDRSVRILEKHLSDKLVRERADDLHRLRTAAKQLDHSDQAGKNHLEKPSRKESANFSKQKTSDQTPAAPKPMDAANPFAEPKPVVNLPEKLNPNEAANSFKQTKNNTKPGAEQTPPAGEKQLASRHDRGEKPLSLTEMFAALGGELLAFLIFGYISVLAITRKAADKIEYIYSESLKPLRSLLLKRCSSRFPFGSLPKNYPGTLAAQALLPSARSAKLKLDLHALAVVKQSLERKLTKESPEMLLPSAGKSPWKAACLSIIPGLGHFYLGQKLRGFLILLIALLFNPLNSMLLYTYGTHLFVSSIIDSHCIVNPESMQLFMALQNFDLLLCLIAIFMFPVFFCFVVYDSFRSAKFGRLKKDRTMVLCVLASIILAFLICLSMTLISIFSAGPSTTARLATTKYVTFELQDEPTEKKERRPSARKGFEKQSSPDDLMNRNRLESPDDKTCMDKPQFERGAEGPKVETALKRMETNKSEHRTSSKSGNPDTALESSSEEKRVLRIPEPDSLPATQSASDAARKLMDAQNQLKNGDLNSALDSLSKAVSLDARNKQTYRLRALVRERLGYWDGSFDDSSKALALDNTDSEMFLLRGRLYHYRFGNDDGAMSSYNEAIRLAPRETEALARRGELRLQCFDDFVGAQEDLKKALLINPVSAPTLTLKSLVENFFLDTEGHKDCLEQAFKADNSYVDAIRLKAVYLEHSHFHVDQDLERSLHNLESAMVLFPGDDRLPFLHAQILKKIAEDAAPHSREREEAYRRSLKELDQLIEKFPQHYKAFYYRCCVKYALGDSDGARSDWEVLNKANLSNYYGNPPWK